MGKKITGFALCAVLLAVRVCVEAQQPTQVPRIGYLSTGSPTVSSANLDAFRQGLRDLGYVEGKNIILEIRWAEGSAERVPELALELVRHKIDVLLVGGGTATALRVKKVTNTVPVVFTLVSDPVGDGLVASLARPGGNLTGLSSVSEDLVGKRLELLKETIPKLSRVAVLLDPNDRANVDSFKEIEAVARPIGVQVQALEVRRPDEMREQSDQQPELKPVESSSYRLLFSLIDGSESRNSR
jgi:putative ABC transport system substrate-binding protein